MNVHSKPIHSVILITALIAVALLAACGSSTPPEPTSTPAMSRDLIAFTSDRDGNSEIYVMNPDGSGMTRLTDHEAIDTDPGWSPDGQHITFMSNRAGSWAIYEMNADGSRVACLEGKLTRSGEADWSPDGSQIAFGGVRSSIKRIYLMNADGSQVTLLTKDSKRDGGPDWSPDGQRIAFASDRSGNWEIYLTSADGGDVTRLTEDPNMDLEPAWSPDGQRIAFMSDRDGNWEIYVMNADGSEVTRLTNDPASDGTPCWSPDGRRIVFASERDGNSEIYVMNADGSGLINLTRNPAKDGTPSWLWNSDQITPSSVETARVPTSEPDTYSYAFDTFLDQAYYEQIQRDPELISSLGLAQAFGTDNSRLTDISDAYQQETYALLGTQLETLRVFDRATLTPEQQLSYDLFEWYLVEQLQGQEFRFHVYPIKPVHGVQTSLIEFMTDLHPIHNDQEARDYVSRLEGFPAKIDQLIEWLETQRAQGIIPPRTVIQQAREQLGAVLSHPPQETTLYTEFEAKLSALSDVSAGQRTQLTQQAARAIETSVIPAYQKLHAYLGRLEEIATDEPGLWKQPQGEAAYAYWLHHHTTTDMTADEIHALGLREVARIQAEMETLLVELGISGDDLTDKMNQVAASSGLVNAQDVLDQYQAIIDHADQNLGELFDVRPEIGVVVVPIEVGASGAYYVEPAVDGSRSGTFYVNLSDGDTYRYSMPSLAYHEAIPGHHFQIALQQTLTDVPTFRKGVGYTAYAEGWALYAEQLAWEAGFYADDPYGNLGRLQYELFRAARLVVDTGLHAQGWSREQAIIYMVENVGYPEAMLTDEVDRYIAWPGQATAYKIGMLKILELRERAREALGDDFDVKSFHNVILKNGAMPLEILERVVDTYIQTELSQ